MIRRGNDLAGAVFSGCERYRFRLWRAWDPSLPRISWCMLNPSTADESVLDPTLRRVQSFSARWGYGAFEVVNLFAWRATDPRELALALEPIGVGNTSVILDSAAACERVIVGWGAPKTSLTRDRADMIAQALRGSDVWCLRANKDGSPVHPLYQRADLEPRPWPAPRTEAA